MTLNSISIDERMAKINKKPIIKFSLRNITMNTNGINLRDSVESKTGLGLNL